MARILVVDDEPGLRELMVTWLTRHAHEVLEATDGKVALRFLADPAWEIDLVLSDIYMPEKDGLEVVMECKRRGVPVIAMTGGSIIPGFDALDLARRFGALAQLAKPFSKDALVASVTEALGRSARPTIPDGARSTPRLP